MQVVHRPPMNITIIVHVVESEKCDITLGTTCTLHRANAVVTQTFQLAFGDILLTSLTILVLICQIIRPDSIFAPSVIGCYVSD